MAHTLERASLLVAALLSAQLIDPHSARAACSGAPPVPEVFRGAKGSIDRPFVVPGDKPGGGPGNPDGDGGRAALILDSCQPATAEFDKQTQVVAIVFNPPSGGTRNALLLAHQCTGVDTTTCANQLGAGSKAVCVKTTVLVSGGGDKGKVIAIDFPDLPSGLPEVAGPAAVIVTDKSALRCDIGGSVTPTCKDDTQASPPLFCVDDLFQGTGCASATKHSVFPSFTVLPPMNDFKDLCKDRGDAPHCTPNTAYAFKFAIDKNGNALVPLRWRGILRSIGSGGIACPDENCDTRVLQGFTSADPFPSDPTKNVIQLPANAVTSFNMRGAEFTPPPQIVAALTADMLELKIDGVAHKGKSVLRFPSGNVTPNAFFDFRDRMKGGVGPIEIQRKGGPGICDRERGGACKTDADCAPDTCGRYRAFAGKHTPRPLPTVAASPPASPPPPPPPPPPPSPRVVLAVLILIAIVVSALVFIWWRSRTP